jgi:ankyrin repeat protein
MVFGRIVKGRAYYYPAPRPVDEKLFEAIQAKNVPQMRALLREGAGANAIVENGWHALLWAVAGRKRALPMAKLLIQHGADVNYREPDGGFTPLTYALENFGCGTDLIRFLLKRGANVGVAVNNGKTALAMSVGGPPEYLKLLLSRGAKVNTRTKTDGTYIQSESSPGPNFKPSGETPIFGLADHWVLADYELLINAGADPKAADDNGWTLLHKSVWNGNLQAVKFLLSHGWNANMASKQGFTPLHLAVIGADSGSRTDLIRLLLRHGANRLLKNRSGQSPADLLRISTEHQLIEVERPEPDGFVRFFLKSQNEILKLVDPGAKEMELPRKAPAPGSR